jgi:hypothetical protein
MTIAVIVLLVQKVKLTMPRRPLLVVIESRDFEVQVTMRICNFPLALKIMTSIFQTLRCLLRVRLDRPRSGASLLSYPNARSRDGQARMKDLETSATFMGVPLCGRHLETAAPFSKA